MQEAPANIGATITLRQSSYVEEGAPVIALTRGTIGWEVKMVSERQEAAHGAPNIESGFDQARSDAFADRMVGVLNSAAIALMTSIGHRAGLFDAMANLPPATSEQIAASAGVSERYVREWLGAMVTGRIVDHNPVNRTYHLPPEHAAWLTRAAGSKNIAMETQFIPLLAGIEEQLLHCFRHGGGVPYSAYPRFQRLMAEGSASLLDAALIDTILPSVPGLIERLRQGIDAADVGCGSGHAVNLMAQAFPASRFVGYDFQEDSVAAGLAEARELGLSNSCFDVHDVAQRNGKLKFDLVTAFDAIHDQAQPAEVLRNIHQALKPDGVFLMVDIAASSELAENLEHPLGPYLYTISCMHCMTVSLAQNGSGLGAMWGEQHARQMLAEAGFARLEVKQIEGDLFNSYFIARKG